MSNVVHRLRRLFCQLAQPRWTLVATFLAWCVYFVGLHGWMMNWGATQVEQQMELPGDQLLPKATCRFTRAITIHAPASDVWQWVVQIGQDRGGFYSNTWLENLTGANIHNASAIHPEWQRRAIGDHVRLARPDLFGGIFANVSQTRIVAMQPDRLIANIPGRFVFQPIAGRTTRLFLREQVPSTTSGRIISALIWDPMHFVMEQRMLRGIKERAEGKPLVPAMMMLIARIGWMLSGVTLLGMFLSRRRWQLWLLLPTVLMIPVVHLTGDWDAALAGFMAIGITLLGALALGRRWWPPYLYIALATALILLLAPDAYAVFGFIFAAMGITWVSGYIVRVVSQGGWQKPAMGS